ncbi:MAG: hypothetical protein ACI9BD_000080 [Candidatus Marinamargulisbacteria bacterium]|jgi:hypothetical protein
MFLGKKQKKNAKQEGATIMPNLSGTQRPVNQPLRRGLIDRNHPSNQTINPYYNSQAPGNKHGVLPLQTFGPNSIPSSDSKKTK